MSEIYQPRAHGTPIRGRPIPVIEKFRIGTDNYLKKRLKIDTSPFVVKNSRPQDIMDGIETYRKLEVTPVEIKQAINNQAKGNVAPAFYEDSSDQGPLSPVTRNTSTKSKESVRFPVTKNLNLKTLEIPSNRGQNALGDSFLFNNSNNSDFDKEVNTSYSKQVEAPKTKAANRYAITTKVTRNVDGNSINQTIRERIYAMKNEAKNNRAVSVDKRKEAVRAVVKEEEKPREVSYDESRANKCSYKTITSAFNSNKTLFDGEWEREHGMGHLGGDPEKLIKQVVEKNVEEAYKNIGLIKKNFQKKSKTYMFYIYKDE